MAPRKNLWLTYAWDDNQDQDVDFIVQQLDNAGLQVKFDKRTVIPGQRIWPELASVITDPTKCDAWGIVVTPNSLKSQWCIEELTWALDRALSSSGAGFPILALLHQVEVKDLPQGLGAPLKARLCISLQDLDWVKKTVDGVNRLPSTYNLSSLGDFICTVHIHAGGFCLEIRPRLERLSPFCVAVDLDEKTSGNVRDCGPGVPSRVPQWFIEVMGIAGPAVIGRNGEEIKVWAWQFDNEASPNNSYYIFYRTPPRRIFLNSPGKKLYEITPTVFS